MKEDKRKWSPFGRCSKCGGLLSYSVSKRKTFCEACKNPDVIV